MTLLELKHLSSVFIFKHLQLIVKQRFLRYVYILPYPFYLEGHLGFTKSLRTFIDFI
jgi:hypothetical protein